MRRIVLMLEMMEYTISITKCFGKNWNGSILLTPLPRSLTTLIIRYALLTCTFRAIIPICTLCGSFIISSFVFFNWPSACTWVTLIPLLQYNPSNLQRPSIRCSSVSFHKQIHFINPRLKELLEKQAYSQKIYWHLM